MLHAKRSGQTGEVPSEHQHLLVRHVPASFLEASIVRWVGGRGARKARLSARGYYCGRSLSFTEFTRKRRRRSARERDRAQTFGWSFCDGERTHHVVVLVLDDVAVVDVVLGCGHPRRQVELGPDGCELAGVRLDRVLEPSLLGSGEEHGTSGVGGGVDPPGDAVRAFIGLLVGLDIEWGSADHLEGHQVRMYRVGVSGHGDVHPVLYRA